MALSQFFRKLKKNPNIWFKCPSCNEEMLKEDLKKNLYVCPKCNYHEKVPSQERISQLTDKNSFKQLYPNIYPVNKLNFQLNYEQKLKKDMEKTKLTEAIIVGEAKISNIDIAIAVMDFRFRGGSMGSVVGEKITLITEYATEKKLPLIIISASGGARMQEGILSLMQMAKTSAAIYRYKKFSNNLYISILTNPTTAGVAASFAALGDIIIAEPKALIGFTGPRVIEQTIRQKLPKGFQTSEFLLEHGLIDLIVDRKQLKNKLTFLLDFYKNSKNIYK